MKTKNQSWRVRRGTSAAVGVATLLACLAAGPTTAASIDVGFMSFDVTGSGTAQFDITNLTGGNATALADPTFPVTSPLAFDVTSLTIDFSDGSTQTFGSSYFTLSADGLSLDGTSIGIGGLSPSPTEAIVTGTFGGASSVSLSTGGTATLAPSFTATLTDSLGLLLDGDAALITATTTTSGGGGTPVPEPDAFWLMALAGVFLGAAVLRRRLPHRWRLAAAVVGGGVVLSAAGSIASAAVTLSTATTPSAGVAGVTFVNLTTFGLPSGVAAGDVTVTLAPTCAAGATTPVFGQLTTTPTSIKSLFGTNRIQFEIPGTANQAAYFVSIAGTSTSGSFASTGCAIVEVSRAPSTGLSACVPSSSLAVATGTNVTAYVPNGYWLGGSTGIEVVPIEGTGSPSTVATASPINSCAANSATGEAVCTTNSTLTYLLNGSTVTGTLNTSSNGFASFSGGSCMNCGVAVNAKSNKAYIAMGFSGSPSRSGIQELDLATNTLSPVFPAARVVSENISVDPTRNLILSPDESNFYELYQLNSTSGAITQEFSLFGVGGEGDSAAEDCSTGIALSSLEFTGSIFISDLTQATFTSGSPGVWAAPSQVQTFPEMESFAAGTDGISVAQGSSHLGVVSGEFGGNRFAVVQLPSSSGSGVPAISDYAVATLPPTPDSFTFQAGFDPHTLTAYTSPNTGKPYGVISDWALGTPSYLAIIDLNALIAAPRQAGTHNVSPVVDLVGSGIVRYVATH